MIFSIAALWGGRKNETNWKSENAEQLIHHIVESNKGDIFYGFELGNEIYGSHGDGAQIPANIAAQDFMHLRKILQSSNSNSNWKVIGTDTAMEINWTKDFFANGTNVVDIFTWHEYPLGSGGSDNTSQIIMDPDFHDRVRIRAQTYERKNALPKGVKLWMGETGGAYGSGKNEVTNRFMFGFISYKQSMFHFYSLKPLKVRHFGT